MRKYLIGICTSVIFFAIAISPVHAVWERSASVEWWTNVCDAVLIAEVTTTERIEPLNELFNSQQVACTGSATLKGKWPNDFSIRQDFRKEKGKEGWNSDSEIRSTDKLLIFAAYGDNKSEREIVFWVNLTHPDADLANHAAYDNDCHLLTKADNVIDLVKARIAKEDPSHPIKRRGVIVNFTPWKGDMSWDFVRTADADYKKILVEELKTEYPQQAIYNLISYPGKETIDLITPFLSDAKTSQMTRHDGKKVTVYPIRQSAFLALKILGVNAREPEGYFSDSKSFEFDTGFESNYFPHGDWKRLDD